MCSAAQSRWRVGLVLAGLLLLAGFAGTGCRWASIKSYLAGGGPDTYIYSPLALSISTPDISQAFQMGHTPLAGALMRQLESLTIACSDPLNVYAPYLLEPLVMALSAAGIDPGNSSAVAYPSPPPPSPLPPQLVGAAFATPPPPVAAPLNGSAFFSRLFMQPALPPPRLRRLVINNCSLTGQLPPDTTWLQLPNLEFLDLASNQLSGALPATLGPSPPLLHVNLSRNRITGPLTDEWARYGGCGRMLDLSYNDLRGDVPNSWVASACAQRGKGGARRRARLLLGEEGSEAASSAAAAAAADDGDDEYSGTRDTAPAPSAPRPNLLLYTGLGRLVTARDQASSASSAALAAGANNSAGWLLGSDSYAFWLSYPMSYMYGSDGCTIDGVAWNEERAGRARNGSGGAHSGPFPFTVLLYGNPRLRAPGVAAAGYAAAVTPRLYFSVWDNACTAFQPLPELLWVWGSFGACALSVLVAAAIHNVLDFRRAKGKVQELGTSWSDEFIGSDAGSGGGGGGAGAPEVSQSTQRSLGSNDRSSAASASAPAGGRAPAAAAAPAGGGGSLAHVIVVAHARAYSRRAVEQLATYGGRMASTTGDVGNWLLHDVPWGALTRGLVTLAIHGTAAGLTYALALPSRIAYCTNITSCGPYLYIVPPVLSVLALGVTLFLMRAVRRLAATMSRQVAILAAGGGGGGCGGSSDRRLPLAPSMDSLSFPTGGWFGKDAGVTGRGGKVQPGLSTGLSSSGSGSVTPSTSVEGDAPSPAGHVSPEPRLRTLPSADATARSRLGQWAGGGVADDGGRRRPVHSAGEAAPTAWSSRPSSPSLPHHLLMLPSAAAPPASAASSPRLTQTDLPPPSAFALAESTAAVAVAAAATATAAATVAAAALPRQELASPRALAGSLSAPTGSAAVGLPLQPLHLLEHGSVPASPWSCEAPTQRDNVHGGPRRAAVAQPDSRASPISEISAGPVAEGAEAAAAAELWRIYEPTCPVGGVSDERSGGRVYGTNGGVGGASRGRPVGEALEAAGSSHSSAVTHSSPSAHGRHLSGATAAAADSEAEAEAQAEIAPRAARILSPPSRASRGSRNVRFHGGDGDGEGTEPTGTSDGSSDGGQAAPVVAVAVVAAAAGAAAAGPGARRSSYGEEAMPPVPEESGLSGNPGDAATSEGLSPCGSLPASHTLAGGGDTGGGGGGASIEPTASDPSVHRSNASVSLPAFSAALAAAAAAAEAGGGNEGSSWVEEQLAALRIASVAALMSREGSVAALRVPSAAAGAALAAGTGAAALASPQALPLPLHHQPRQQQQHTADGGGAAASAASGSRAVDSAPATQQASSPSCTPALRSLRPAALLVINEYLRDYATGRPGSGPRARARRTATSLGGVLLWGLAAVVLVGALAAPVALAIAGHSVFRGAQRLAAGCRDHLAASRLRWAHRWRRWRLRRRPQPDGAASANGSDGGDRGDSGADSLDRDARPLSPKAGSAAVTAAGADSGGGSRIDTWVTALRRDAALFLGLHLHVAAWVLCIPLALFTGALYGLGYEWGADSVPLPWLFLATNSACLAGALMLLLELAADLPTWEDCVCRYPYEVAVAAVRAAMTGAGAGVGPAESR
ncbi:hypothetical protein GPECTOR_13g780 [Gonium pectorale]|uniref:Uncharacterized protein n=1 Tax=Gonium pectorale TaxID=33097 RepID=A0A150GN76_GONPE|nr:hypothetical protein GPECTOR_13g780 [Gonium pectorale]|eukprot:KXZ51293.1 hypothetical protein GPECTOR_13g780 [Gonium pectorale]